MVSYRGRDSGSQLAPSRQLAFGSCHSGPGRAWSLTISLAVAIITAGKPAPYTRYTKRFGVRAVSTSPKFKFARRNRCLERQIVASRRTVFLPMYSVSPSRRPLRLLTFTTLFPNSEQPNHGAFVENRLRH